MAQAVQLSWRGDGVALVEMAEREGRNTFTKPLVAGLATAFQAIAARADAKVVVVHGYESVFSAGGTLDELIGIADQKQKFDEAGFYRLLLDCPLPVVAAMQGHALGGGLVLGLYADLIVLSTESLYSANFMKYGFTPGMGATFILPHKFGPALGAEMLFTANGYHGGALAARGIGLPVVARAETVATAVKLARDLAEKPAVSLRLLKQALSAPILAALPAVIEREKAMHDVTFAQPDIREQIRARFGQ
jgi:polyketide biosynthesis enoyl-CoA hydratase PksI